MMMLAGAKAEVATDLVATLNHEGGLKAFYGQSALSSAYTAATDGDVITLSAGTFYCPKIEKNITLRGVGAWTDLSTGNRITYVQSATGSSISIKLQNNDYEFLAEGIYFVSSVSVTSDYQKECTFSKTYFGGMYSGDQWDRSSRSVFFGNAVYAKVQHCVARYVIDIYKGICSNCVFPNVYAYSGSAPIVLQNCVLSAFCYNQSSNSVWNFSEDILSNCILIGSYTYSNKLQYLASSNDVHNCAYFSINGEVNDIFKNIANNSNMIVEDRDNFFKNASLVTKKVSGDVTTYTVSTENLGTDCASGLYELSDDAKQLYKGNDGTVVGVWGGTTPFDFVPNNPRLSKCEIVPRVGDDGKLNITIEVAQ